MRGTRLRATACALGLALAAQIARADTPINGWDAARDPGAEDRYELHLRVRELMATARLVPRNTALLRARALLLQADAEKSPDVRLRFDLGEIYAALEDNIRTIEVLEPALDEAPDHPAAHSPYVDLANAYAKLDRSVDERRVYERYLPRVTDEASRSIALLNLAEADMHLGDLDAAVTGYRAALEVSAQLPNMIEIEQHTGTLARWGLAVALDRSGDVAGGAKEARLAVELDHDMAIIRGSPNVFFSPERERNWYVALGYAEYAKASAEARASATFWRRSEGCWREYIDDVRAHAAADRWVDVARARLERAHAQRVAAEKRVKGGIAYAQAECVR
jgi:tetratricopeptide (TPR) repeat protein